MKSAQYRFKFYFNASHAIYLSGEAGENHPHTWELTLNVLKATDNFVQFKEIEKTCEEFLLRYQDVDINKIKPFTTINPTLENICIYFKEKLQEILYSKGWLLVSIELAETPARAYVINITDEIDAGKGYFKNKRNEEMQKIIKKKTTEKIDSIVRRRALYSEHSIELERVKNYFNEHNITNEIILLEKSSATVELAAKALCREPGEIAKSLALKLKDGSVIMVVVCGTARIDNRRYKDTFKCKAQMLSHEETQLAVGYPVGGVCPFALPKAVKVYLDDSLKKYYEVYPAAGTANSAVRFTLKELEQATGGTWVHVTQDK
ncbi:MAG: YbaK/EbsC family protein [Eubacteriales bacterium]|nr:YbaK/EbsC family protein [Eubacteriales bacterium]